MPKRKKIPPKPPLPVEGYPRPYVRDGVPGLPVEEQITMLEALGFDLSQDKTFWIDRLSRREIQAKAALPMRDQAVNSPYRGETVYLPTLRALGWDHQDTNKAILAAQASGTKIYCVDTGQVISAETPADELLKMLTQAEAARRRQRTERASRHSRGLRKSRVDKAIEAAKELIAGPLTMKAIAKQVGVSTRTLYARGLEKGAAIEEKKYGTRHA